MRANGRTISVILTLTAWAVAAGAVSHAQVSPPVRLTVDPPVVQLSPGQRQLVAVEVRNVPTTGLAAFQIELRFDPLAFQVMDPNRPFVSSGVPVFAPLGGSALCAAVRQLPTCPDPEWMLTSTGRQPFGTASIDNTEGRVTIAFGTAGDAIPPSGGGALALLEIVGTGGGRSRLRIGGAILADGNDPPRKYAIATRPKRPSPGRDFRNEKAKSDVPY